MAARPAPSSCASVLRGAACALRHEGLESPEISPRRAPCRCHVCRDLIEDMSYHKTAVADISRSFLCVDVLDEDNWEYGVSGAACRPVAAIGHRRTRGRLASGRGLLLPLAPDSTRA